MSSAQAERQKQEAKGLYFEIHRQGRDGDESGAPDSGEWRWRLKDANHEVIANGKSYANHADCLRAVFLVRGTSSHTPIRDA